MESPAFTKHPFPRLFLLVAGLLFLAVPFARAAEVTVFAAASLTEALKQIAAGYEKQTGDKIIFNFGASSVLARQIEEGAPADLFFSADEAKMDALEKKGLILKETRKSRLSNTLVIVVARKEGAVIQDPKDLVSNQVKILALAEPSSVPAGIYAKAYLQKQNLWTALESKVVPTDNVRGALAAVEAGNADAAIVYKTDAAISTKAKIAYEVPSSETPGISYPLAVTKEGKNTNGARRFAIHLESSEASRIFQKQGFLIRH